MRAATDSRKEIISLTKELPEDRLQELVDFAQFLKAKEQGFSYSEVKDSIEYVRNVRSKEGERVKSGGKFVKELIERQKSSC